MSNVEIEVYADEQFGKKYICIGCLFVPMDKKNLLAEALSNMRCLHLNNKKWYWDFNHCPCSMECREDLHRLNNTEIHYKELDKASSAGKEISKKWLEFIIGRNKKGKDQILFNLLYINLDNLNRGRFGLEKTDENIYNRFFRSCLSYGAKSFFDDERVTIKKVYHDKASVEGQGYFPYFNLQKLENLNYDKISIEDYNIKFLNSDHKKEDIFFRNDCQLIQLIDLIIGTASQNIYNISDNSIKKERAMIIRPLIKRLLEHPRNYRSSFHYYGKQNISAFPKYKIENALQKLLDGEITETLKDKFYSPKLEMPYYDIFQTALN